MRLSYFYGQMLGHHELSTEQRYHRDKHELHNRCLHGHGVVCGLAVIPPAAPATDTTVVVECGLAIDPAGHDVIVRTPITVDLFKSLSAADQARLDEQNGTTLWISACFQEQRINPTRPVLPDACGAAPDCMYGMIREGVCIVVTVDEPVGDTRCDACCEAIDEKVDPCVLLARIDGFKKGQPLAATAIHNEVRRAIATWVPTTITGINWTHGGSYTASPNAKQLLGDAGSGSGGLEIQFSADVQAESIVDGVIDVFRLRPNGDVAYIAGKVTPGATARSLIFRRDANSASFDPGDRISIALHSSFLLDMCCRPIDGTHVGGRVPLLPNADAGSTTPQTTVCLTPPRGFVWTSGVGTAGGDFLSWFTVG
jgi:hypothetical protein